MENTNSKGAQTRDKNGQYSNTIEWEALCACGHTLGHHLAGKKGFGGGCIECDYTDVVCDCDKFRKVK